MRESREPTRLDLVGFAHLGRHPPPPTQLLLGPLVLIWLVKIAKIHLSNKRFELNKNQYLILHVYEKI